MKMHDGRPRGPVSRYAALAVSIALLPACAGGQEFEEWNAKFQSTYVWQRKNALSASYSGPNSLSVDREKSYSFTTTIALGMRPWTGGELYFNPEAAQGVPLSGLTGLGGFTNGEMARTSGPRLKVYRARLFARQTWGLGGEQESLESDANQLAGKVDKNRIVLTAGNLSVIDIFDDNAFSHDPRTQFLNWSLMTHGAYDYAADARGYSWGAAMEWYGGDWAARIGRFIQPREPNQQQLDSRIFRHYGDQVEFEHAHSLGELPGKVRVLAFRNRARMSRFADAIAQAAISGTVPDINNARFGEQVKRGFGVNVEQNLPNDAGIFFRASRSDGATETYAFTEIDQSLSGGVLGKGTSWGRPGDAVGLAMARNGISAARRNYLAAGGVSFFIGDGRLNYRPEQVIECFYSLNLAKGLSLTADLQQIRNPAYNADRGPARTAALRMHAEF